MNKTRTLKPEGCGTPVRLAAHPPGRGETKISMDSVREDRLKKKGE